MEINNLLSKIRHQEEEPKTFLALEITEEIVQAAVWHVVNARTEVVKIGTQEYWNNTTNKEKLLSAVDATLAKATEGLSQEPDEIVFGLPHSWIKENDITSDKKLIIKTICKGLELQPLGYVVLTESLVRYLKIREGTPATAIIVHVTDVEITVSLIKLGRIIGTHSVGRSEDIAYDVEEGISRFKSSDNLPSRIIVFDGSHDMEDIVQNLNSYDWQSKFNFLHLPKIEALPKDAGISAVAVAGGSEVASSIGFEIDFDKSVEDDVNSMFNEPKPKIEKQDSNIKNIEALGFVKDKDIKKIGNSPSPESTEPETAAPISNSNSTTPRTHPTPPSSPSILSKVKGIKLPNFTFLSNLPKLPILIGVSALIVIMAIFAGILWIIPKTSLTVFIEPKSIDESIELTISERVSSPDLENNIIPATVVTKTVQGEDTTESTGTQTVGEPAKGEVTIYNRTTVEKTFDSGTVISTGDIDFTLDNEITIEAGNIDNDYVGKATASVTADAIGEESNLDSDNEFTVDNYSTSSFVARNSSPFTGGSSSEIRVVSQTDIDNLLNELTSKLEEQAKSDLMTEANDEKGIYIQEDLTEVVSSNYSASVGDEKSSLTLELEIQVQGLSYNNKDIEELITGNVNNSIPSGYKKANQPIEVEPQSQTARDEEVVLEAVVKVKLLPDINESALKNSLKGKSAADAEEILKKIPGFQKAALSITPKWLPPRFKVISRNPSSITLSIESQ